MVDHPSGPRTQQTRSFDGRDDLERGGAARERPPSMVPPRIGRYAISRRLGAGGMGEVFAATDDVLGRELAIKLVHAELDDGRSLGSSRLMREAQTLAQVNHPNVVQIYEVGTWGEHVYLAMEVVRGTTLRTWARGPVPVQRKLEVLADTARGLHAIHRVGLVHRDVKPDNVIIGDDGRVRLVDFGLTRVGEDVGAAPAVDAEAFAALSNGSGLPQRLTVSGAVVGTPVYMAPEQLHLHVIDARCDQFAFCVMAWEALTGERPFSGGSMSALFVAHRRGPTIPSDGPVPRRVWQVLAQGLVMEPTARWPDMQALTLALEDAMRPRVRWPRVFAVAGLTAAAIAVPLVAVPADAPLCSGVGLEGARARASLEHVDALRRVDGSPISRPDLDALGIRVATLAQRREAVCRAADSEPGLGPSRVAGCLDRAMHRIDALLDADGSPRGSAAMAAAIAALPEVADCEAAAASGPPRPEDPETARRVDDLRSELDDALTALALGHAVAIAQREPGLRAMAEATGDAPLLGEVAYLGGEIAAALGQGERAQERLLSAADLAESSRHDVLAADAWAALADVAIEQLVDAALARHYLRRAEASAARIGAPPARARLLQLRRAQLAKLEGDTAAAAAELAPLMSQMPANADLDPSWWPVLVVGADIIEVSGDLDGALALHRRHRAALVARLGEDHVDVAMAEYNIGKVQLLRGEPELARASLERAELLWTSARGATHPDLALVHTVLEQLELHHGTLARARDHAETVLELQRAAHDGDHPDVGLAWLGLGAIALMQDDAEGAAQAYRASLAIHEHTLGADHPQTALVRLNLAEAMIDTDDRLRVLPIVDEALATLAAVEGIDPALLAFAHRLRAAALRVRGSWTEAAAALDAAEAASADASDPLEAGLLALERVRIATHLGEPEALARAVAHAREITRGGDGESAAIVRARLHALVRSP